MYKSEFPTAGALVYSSTFMDDFAAVAENDNCLTKLYYELISLMNRNRLPMAKWAKNSKHLKEVWRNDVVDFKEVRQTLLIDWDTECYTFSMDSRDVNGEYVEGPTNKRQIKQAAARFYEPFGLLSPVSVVG